MKDLRIIYGEKINQIIKDLLKFQTAIYCIEKPVLKSRMRNLIKTFEMKFAHWANLLEFDALLGGM